MHALHLIGLLFGLNLFGSGQPTGMLTVQWPDGGCGGGSSYCADAGNAASLPVPLPHGASTAQVICTAQAGGAPGGSSGTIAFTATIQLSNDGSNWWPQDGGSQAQVVQNGATQVFGWLLSSLSAPSLLNVAIVENTSGSDAGTVFCTVVPASPF
jgi:hypothetical protein